MAATEVQAPAVEAPQAGQEEALSRRLLPKWDDRRPAGLIPKPMPGRGPEGEEIVASLCSGMPAEIDKMGGMGWSPAQTGCGEILNEESYTRTPEGRLIYSDMVVIIRSAEYDRKDRQAELDAAARHSNTLDIPDALLREGGTEVHVLKTGDEV